MIKVKAISVREKEELEPLLIAHPDIIEDGLKILTHQHPTDSGPLEILAEPIGSEPIGSGLYR